MARIELRSGQVRDLGVAPIVFARRGDAPYHAFQFALGAVEPTVPTAGIGGES